MKPNSTQFDAYFSGHANAEDEQALATQLASDPALADQFVAEAKLDALLGEIYRAQRTEAFQGSLLSVLQPEPTALTVVPPVTTSVVRGPFPYWRQVAAVLVGGLLLWGIVGVWHGASQVAGTKRQGPRVQVQSGVASSGGSPAVQTEDRDLEAWLREYYVDAQPAKEQTLAAWVAQLVEHEFPLHNHLNKHQRLGWEIRAKDLLVRQALEQKSLHLSCGAASLLTQVQGIAALAGCEVVVETDKIVLTPMRESSSGLETRNITLAESFGNGSGPVNVVAAAQGVAMDHFLWTDLDLVVGETRAANPDEAIKLKLMSCGIDWPEGASVAELTEVLPQVTFSIPSKYEEAQLTEGFIVPEVPDAGLVVASPRQAKVTNTPKGLRQLEILAGLRVPAAIPSNFQVLDFAFPLAEAPKDPERVLNAAELAELEARWQKTAAVYHAGIQPTTPEASQLSSGLALAWAAAAENATLTNWTEVPASMPASTKSLARLSLQRSGESLRIAGEINLLPPPEPAPIVAYSDDGLDGLALDYQGATTHRLDLTRKSIAPQTRGWKFQLGTLPEVAPVDVLPGVDVALSLYEGQAGVVIGPQESGRVHYYLLKWVK